MYVRAGRPAFARPCVEVHKSTSLMSSSGGLIYWQSHGEGNSSRLILTLESKLEKEATVSADL